ncbi:MAG: hypothetical protein ACTSU5_10925 [Promethearchaeota archaeon]
MARKKDLVKVTPSRERKPGEYVKEIHGIKIYYPNFEKFKEEFRNVRSSNISYAKRVKATQGVSDKVLQRRFTI